MAWRDWAYYLQAGHIYAVGFLEPDRCSLGIDIGAIHPAYGLLSEQVGGYVNERTGEDFKYRVNGFSCNFQKINANYSIAQFLFERRGTMPIAKTSTTRKHRWLPFSILMFSNIREQYSELAMKVEKDQFDALLQKMLQQKPEKTSAIKGKPGNRPDNSA